MITVLKAADPEPAGINVIRECPRTLAFLYGLLSLDRAVSLGKHSRTVTQ